LKITKHPLQYIMSYDIQSGQLFHKSQF